MTPAPQFPAGEYLPEPNPSPERRTALISTIAELPVRLRSILNSLEPGQLDQKYRDWTGRQIVHHLVDSHANAYVRFRLALTEDSPTIKPYLEGRWATLPDAESADVDVSVTMLTAMHQRWTILMHALTDEQWRRAYVHPQYGRSFPLNEALGLYAHHGRHHAAQLEWMATHRSL